MNVLKKENHPDVIYLGKLDFDHVISLYHQSDVFCLPTDYPEGFPTTVLEAAASDCYVIATEKGGSGELILSEEYGMILQENNAKNIAEAIKKAILDDKYRASAIKKAKTFTVSTDTTVNFTVNHKAFKKSVSCLKASI